LPILDREFYGPVHGEHVVAIIHSVRHTDYFISELIQMYFELTREGFYIARRRGPRLEHGSLTPFAGFPYGIALGENGISMWWMIERVRAGADVNFIYSLRDCRLRRGGI
jgi:hypothetical protein